MWLQFKTNGDSLHQVSMQLHHERHRCPPIAALLAVAAGASVANVYAQPLLDRLAQAFALDRAVAGAVLAATQAGSVLALLGLLPLADRGDRRRLLRMQLMALVVALLWLAAARTAGWLLSGMLLAGLGHRADPGLDRLYRQRGPPEQRGRLVGVVQGGVFIGLLLARVVSGAVAATVGWQAVYLLSAALMAALPCCCGGACRRCRCRRYHRAGANCWVRCWACCAGTARCASVGRWHCCCLLASTCSGRRCLLPLSAPPLHWSTAAIGALGLAGVVGALMAARVGHWMDRGFAGRVSLGALLLMLAAWWPLLGLPQSLSLLLLGVIVLDLGGQALHVSNQALLLRAPAEQHGRLVALYMLFYAVGSGAGAAAGPWMQARHGWPAVCLLGAGIAALALLWWAAWRVVASNASAGARTGRADCR
jgi:MFS family permease